MADGDARRDQIERAQQAWELRVLDSAEPEVLAAARRVLRIKRFELERFAAGLPGPVRRGARVDLEPLARALEQAGVRCELVRRGWSRVASAGPDRARTAFPQHPWQA